MRAPLEPAERESRRSVLPRRDILRSMAGLLLLSACGRAPEPPAPLGASRRVQPRPRRADFGGPVAVHSWFDLPDDPRSRELSGIAWDDASGTLWAVQDETANIVAVVPDELFRSWRLDRVVKLAMSFPLDLEGIVVIPGGFIVASEKGPRILEVDRDGKLRRDVPLPEHFSKARDNKSLESLTLSPDGTHLFSTTEGALSCDGAMPTRGSGTLLRLLRMTREGGDVEEHAYRTDPLPSDHAGDYGVADLAAVGNDELLVLERGWARGFGNTARIYRVSLAGATTSCLASPALADDVPVLAKELLVDFATLSSKGVPSAKQKQSSPLLDNYEGLAVGPILRDGRRSLLLVSDDNNRADQVARIVVLAVG